MRNSKIYAAAMSAVLAFGLTMTSCDDDKEMFQITESPASSAVSASRNSVTVTEDNLNDVLLTLSYESAGPITVNGEATNIGVYILQSSTDSSFPESGTSNSVLTDTKGTNEIALTGNAINVLALGSGIQGGESGTIYFRIVHALAADDLTGASYGDPVAVTVNTYRVLFQWLMLAGAEKEASEAVDSLYSEKEDGIYTGFIGANAWWNWTGWDMYGNAWGTNDGDGWTFCHIVSATAVSSEATLHQWLTANEGCYYITANTNTGAVEYTYFNDLSIGGDVNGLLNFDLKTCQWTTVINTTADNQKFSITGNVTVFNSNTGQEEGVASTFSFAGSDGILTIGSGEITVPKAGSYKLVLDLNNASKYVYKLEDMSDVVTYPDKVIAVVGSDETELETEIAGGLASGIYTGKVNVNGNSIAFKDGAGNNLDVSVVDEAGNTINELTEGIKYVVTVDLVKNEAILKEILISETLTITSVDQSKELGVLSSEVDADGNPTGVYSGWLAFESDDHITAVDGYGVYYGVDDSWNQYSFIANRQDDAGHHKFWTPANGLEGAIYYVTFSIPDQTWEIVETIESNTVFVMEKGTNTVSSILSYNEETYTYDGEMFKDVRNSWDFFFYFAKDGELTKYGCDTKDWDSAYKEATYGMNRSGSLLEGDNNQWIDNTKSFKVSVDLESLAWSAEEIIE